MAGRPAGGERQRAYLAENAAPSHALVRHPAAAFGAALVLQATALGPGQ
jgi:hypothetical protein